MKHSVLYSISRISCVRNAAWLYRQMRTVESSSYAHKCVNARFHLSPLFHFHCAHAYMSAKVIPIFSGAPEENWGAATFSFFFSSSEFEENLNLVDLVMISICTERG